MSDRLILKPVAVGQERLPFLEACNRILHTQQFRRPVTGVVVTVVYEDGTVSTGSVNLSPFQAGRAVDMAKEALNGRKLFSGG